VRTFYPWGFPSANVHTSCLYHFRVPSFKTQTLPSFLTIVLLLDVPMSTIAVRYCDV
jgi:hypothetical protein